MNLKRTYVFILGLMLLMTTIVSAQKNDKLPKLKYTEYKLKNGLNVILHQDKSTPIVAVNVWYHVGSKNEEKGKTGFAHLFEHMMFQGSENYNDEYFGPLQKAGANINGSTNPDRTNYYEVVPSNFLELALFMESDRMGNLLPAMTMDKLNNQRDVVKNERRQNYDNRPYGTAFEKIGNLMYPEEHPYSWTTIGSLEDLSAASMEDVQEFFRKYYAPNNASLVIAGDFDEKQAKIWVEKYFGSIKKGEDIDRPNPKAPSLDKEIRKTYEDDVRLPRRYMVWHTPPANHPDEAPLDVLAAILSNGRGSRFQSKLVYEQEKVQSIFAANFTREIGGTFLVVPTARPGVELDEVEKLINAELEDIKKNPPSKEEVMRATNGVEAQFVFGLQTVLGKADSMNSNTTFMGNPDTFQQQLDKYRAVTSEDVQRVAKQYLGEGRLVMTFVRGEKDGTPKNTAANRPTSVANEDEESEEKVSKTKETDYTKNLPKAGANPKFSIPSIEKKKLSNGMNVWIVPQNELPIISMNMVINTGGSANPSGKEGLASLTAGLMDSGTKTRSATDISNAQQEIGASIRINSDWDSTDASMQTLTKHLDTSLDVYTDVLTNPVFPKEEFETARKRVLIGFLQRKDNPNAIAEVAYSKLLYGTEHPYGRSLGGDEKSIGGISRDDMVKFYETYYRPNNATLIVVGNVTSKMLMPKLEKAFANWKPASVPEVKIPTPDQFDQPGIYIIDKPGAAQSIVNIGQIGVSRDNPDYVPLQVMNSILGGQFSARLNLNLREDKGYTYGARSGFSYRRGAGPFTASAGVQTAVTKESVIEFIKELNGVRGDIPVTEDELDYNKQSVIRRFPRTMETVGQISGQLSNLLVYGLNDSYFNDYLTKVNAVTLKDVNRVANKYLTPEKMAILIVGDRSVIEPKLKEIDDLGGKIRFLDTEGNPEASMMMMRKENKK